MVVFLSTGTKWFGAMKAVLGHISEPTLSDHKMPTVSADPDPGKTNSMGGSKAAAAGSSPKGLAENAASRSIPAKQYNILFEKRNKKQAEKKIIGSIVLASSFALPNIRGAPTRH